MPFGASIKRAIKYIGAEFTVVRTSISGEYAAISLNAQATKPFIREFFLEAELAYDTGSIAGDIIRFNLTDERGIIMNRTPEVFEGEVAKYNAVIYKCNVSGELTRPLEGARDNQLAIPTSFPSVQSDVYALMTEALYGHDLETDEELGALGLSEHELYIPASVGAQILDRFEPASGEYYMLATKKKRKYENVDVFSLEVDTR